MGLGKHDKVSKMKKTGLGVLGVGVLVAGIWAGSAGVQPVAVAQTTQIQADAALSSVPVAVASAAKNVSLANVAANPAVKQDYTQVDKAWMSAAAHIRGTKEIEVTKQYTPAYAAHLVRLEAKQKEEKLLNAKRAAMMKDPEYVAHLKRLAMKQDPAYQAHLQRLAAKQQKDREYQEHLDRLALQQAASGDVDPALAARPDYDPVTGEIISIYDRDVDQIPRFHKDPNPRTQNLLARLSGGTASYKDVSTMTNAISVEATGYVADCIGCSGITATGLDVRYSTPQVVAVDPRVIPLGTKLDLWVEGVYFGVYTASDTGGLIKGNRIDILFETSNDAVRFGRRSAIVKVHEGAVNIEQPVQVAKPTIPNAVQVSSNISPAAVKEQEAARLAKAAAVKAKAEKQAQAEKAKKDQAAKVAAKQAAAKKAEDQKAWAAKQAKLKAAALEKQKAQEAKVAAEHKAAKESQAQEAAPVVPAKVEPAPVEAATTVEGVVQDSTDETVEATVTEVHPAP